jgi:ubiquinone/menaquinone biosynthesis C-methylase UbiE
LVPEPQPGARLLEFGAGPYFTSLMMMKFRPGYEFHWANYFDATWVGQDHAQTIHSEAYNETHTFNFKHFNSETDDFPYPDEHFDYVMYCEIIEHLTRNPSRVLAEVHRILKPGGKLMITTPNVVRLQHVLYLLQLKNVFDPYSGYGPYGRHNREYTPQELIDLVTSCGYAVDQVKLEDMNAYPLWRRTLHSLRTHFKDNIYLVAQKTKPRVEGRPAWLYRSFF